MSRRGVPRAALYARVSTHDKGQDPELQLEDLRALCRARGWEVREEFVDLLPAGDARPELERMLAEVRRGRIDVVLVWRFDRFARSTMALLAALEDFRARGVDFVSHQEAVDTSTPAGKLLFTMIAAMAEFEKGLIQERVRAGVAKAQRDGKHCGRPRREGPSPAEVRRAVETHGGIKPAARALSLPVTTVRRRLVEAGAEGPG